jgi:hypothetical protein
MVDVLPVFIYSGGIDLPELNGILLVKNNFFLLKITFIN